MTEDPITLIYNFLWEKLLEGKVSRPRYFYIGWGWDKSHQVVFGRYNLLVNGSTCEIIFGHHGLYEVELSDPDSLETIWNFICERNYEPVKTRD